MKPVFHPQLVNDPSGDPALYVEFLFERRALLIDLGDISGLTARKILRLSHIFVSHTHMDHFIGFDQVVRTLLGRSKRLHLFGPDGFIDQVGHRLSGYTWNLVQHYESDFTVVATEIRADGTMITAQFRCRTGFQMENKAVQQIPANGQLLDEQRFRVRACMLDHKIPCLAFTLEEKQHVNIWKNRLEEMGLPTGAWLQDLKSAVLHADVHDQHPFRVWWRSGGKLHERHFPLGLLKDRILSISRGQKITYVVDAVYHETNAQRIVALAQDSDYLFIEATFREEERGRAAITHHLTAYQAGVLGHRAKAKRLIPFHFSTRYSGAEECLRQEALGAFAGGHNRPSSAIGAPSELSADNREEMHATQESIPNHIT